MKQEPASIGARNAGNAQNAEHGSLTRIKEDASSLHFCH
jgi:hypothetical protein